MINIAWPQACPFAPSPLRGDRCSSWKGAWQVCVPSSKRRSYGPAFCLRLGHSCRLTSTPVEDRLRTEFVGRRINYLKTTDSHMTSPASTPKNGP